MEARIARSDLTDSEWSVIGPFLPNEVCSMQCADDRWVLNGIFQLLHTGAPWANKPDVMTPIRPCVSRFNLWRKVGVWDHILQTVSKTYAGKLQMIDSSSIRMQWQKPSE